VPALLRECEHALASITADGAYDLAPVYKSDAARQPGSSPEVIRPPRADAVLDTDDPMRQSTRGHHIQLLAERGRIGRQRATGYRKRNDAETAMSRYKHLIGPKLRARARPSQHGEVALRSRRSTA